jgi:hypothetical protein
MWLFLSRRLRMWLLLAVGLPLARAVVHRLAVAVGERRPQTAPARALASADAGLTRFTERTRRRRKKK